MYDIAIVGAGPAGAIFAKTLAEKNTELKILLIDGSEDVKKVCGGLLSPSAQKQLAMLGLTLPTSILENPQIFSVDVIDLGKNCKRHYSRQYINMDRQSFDGWLLSLVPDSVKILKGRCLDIQRSENEYTLTVKSSGAAEKFTAASVAGADGGSSVVRRSLFDKKIYHYASIQEWYKISDERLPSYSCIYDRETSDNCSWTIRKGDYFIFGGSFVRNGCRESFEKQKKQLEKYLGIEFGEPVKKEACLLTNPKRAGDILCGKPGAYLLGEAAGFITADSFEGISSALHTGRMLGEAFAEGKNHEDILKIYKAKTQKQRRKIRYRIFKMRLLCSPTFRHLIMKSGIKSFKPY